MSENEKSKLEIYNTKMEKRELIMEFAKLISFARNMRRDRACG